MSEETNRILEGEAELLLDHDYDGIQELDNPLPNWWKMTFYGGIAFAVPYFLYYVVIGGPTLYQEYQKELAIVEKIREQRAQDTDHFDIEDYRAWVVSNEGVQKGAIIFSDNCMACHADRGQGDIGPNLTDSFWLHGDGGVEAVYRMVVNGFEENGMPPWKEFLSKEDIFAVTSFVESIKNTNIEGKGPEGVEISP